MKRTLKLHYLPAYADRSPPNAPLNHESSMEHLLMTINSKISDHSLVLYSTKQTVISQKIRAGAYKRSVCWR
jgi:hypothetical protein